MIVQSHAKEFQQIFFIKFRHTISNETIIQTLFMDSRDFKNKEIMIGSKFQKNYTLIFTKKKTIDSGTLCFMAMYDKMINGFKVTFNQITNDLFLSSNDDLCFSFVISFFVVSKIKYMAQYGPFLDQ